MGSMIPGWVVAIPLVVFVVVSFFLVAKFARPERYNVWMLVVLGGVVLYFLAAIPFRVEAEESRPPVTPVTPVSCSGDGVPV